MTGAKEGNEFFMTSNVKLIIINFKQPGVSPRNTRSCQKLGEERMAIGRRIFDFGLLASTSVKK
jgi:hypothetical protein